VQQLRGISVILLIMGGLAHISSFQLAAERSGLASLVTSDPCI
jgi:hypothetical protein